MKKEIHQGEVYMVTIDNSIGSEQIIKGRPCLIIQNEKGNEHSKTTIIIPLTKKNKKDIPTHYLLHKKDYPFLEYDSLALGEQIRTVDIEKRILERKIGQISEKDLLEIIKVVYNNFS